MAKHTHGPRGRSGGGSRNGVGSRKTANVRSPSSRIAKMSVREMSNTPAGGGTPVIPMDVIMKRL